MNKNTSSLVAAIWLLLLAALATTHADAQTVPALINYQGKLVNSNGLPVSTGDYQLRFRIYDAVANGNLIWGPQVFNGQTGPGYGPLVPVVQGWFNVMLGPVDTNGAALTRAFDGSDRFLEIQLSNSPPVSPRQQILSAPYAFRAEAAASLIGGITSTQIVDGAVTFPKLASRAIGTNAGSIAVSLPIAPSGMNDIFQTSSGNWVDVTNLVVTIETTDRPVWVGFVPSQYHPNIEPAHIYIPSGGSGGAAAQFAIIRDGDGVSRQRVGNYVANSLNKELLVPPGAIMCLDQPGRGIHTYRVQVRLESGTDVRIINCRLMVYEL